MRDQTENDDELLARLVREAGDPCAKPERRYAENLRAAILDRAAASPATGAAAESSRKAVVFSLISRKGGRRMKRFARNAVAATVLAAVGALCVWLVVGGSTNIALAAVAEALESLRTATYDEAVEVKDPKDGSVRTFHSKSMFLAPSHQRNEMSMSTGTGKDQDNGIMIMDTQAMKAMTLVPEQKQAITVDLTKIKRPAGSPLNTFDFVRQIVREGKDSGGAKVESLGTKEIDGRMAVGFRTQSNMADMTFWADPQTARPVRIELVLPAYNNSRSVMSNFRYDMDLDPSLFSLEPPAGYTVNNTEAAMPVEEDLIDMLRLVAKHNNGVFPPAIAANREFTRATEAEAKAIAEELLQTPEAKKLQEKLMAEYGDDREAGMKWYMKEWMKFAEPITQKRAQTRMQGVLFYSMLQPDNDAHYVGKDVKADTPDRPIFWYKPTGAEKYRVIYADLSVKELAPEEVKQLPEGAAK
jgi:outer membrane lipoprotein-sorting protein